MFSINVIAYQILLRSGNSFLIIVLESTVDLVEKIQRLFPNLDLRDFPSLEPYAYLETADIFHDYLEQEASKGKGAFIQAVWTVIGKLKFYNFVTKAWSRVPRLYPWFNWLKWCWMGPMGRNGPIACLMCPIHAPSASLPYISKKERSVAMCFTKSAFYNTWTFATPVPSTEHRL
ncbi:hypothetical protein TNCV_1306761 [Trichonephila clavipes]|nr:hypothetical protein TNCV_1306761 [Trichonephila clavipes]